jgi:hypothetical protein
MVAPSVAHASVKVDPGLTWPPEGDAVGVAVAGMLIS